MGKMIVTGRLGWMGEWICDYPLWVRAQKTVVDLS